MTLIGLYFYIFSDAGLYDQQEIKSVLKLKGKSIQMSNLRRETLSFYQMFSPYKAFFVFLNHSFP